MRITQGGASEHAGHESGDLWASNRFSGVVLRRDWICRTSLTAERKLCTESSVLSTKQPRQVQVMMAGTCVCPRAHSNHSNRSEACPAVYFE